MSEGTYESRLGELTLQEKIDLLDGSDFWRTTGIARLGIPAVMLTDGPHGLRKQLEGGDHAGLFASFPATCFPPAAGLASSWNPTLVAQVGAAIAVEARAAEVAVILGPGVNMKRSPLCGRNFEYFSEDPLLAGTLGAAFVRAAQAQGVATSVKHYAVNNQETDRMTVSADIDERTIREIYLPAFEQVVRDGQPWTVMCSYNRVNGVYVSEDPWLLTTVLRDEWGFDGLVMSDWGAVNERPAALAAGLDLEMPSSSGSGSRRISTALADGDLDEAHIDRAAATVLQLLDRVTATLTPGQGFEADAHHDLARTAALQSAVLLKNDGDLLPLDPTTGGTIAVIGQFAATPRFQGAGSSQVNPTRVDIALDSIRDLLTGRRELVFVPGYRIDDDRVDHGLIEEAVTAARDAAVTVLFLGLPPAAESEGWDRTHLDLPNAQQRLVAAVTEVTDRVVVVLSNGSVVNLEPWRDTVPAILEGWLLGQAGGSATAQLLFGLEAPSGRLAETIPLRLTDTPAFGNFPGESGHVRYGEGLLIGYRWYDTRDLPVAYPFGHGLTYTRFRYDDAVVEVLDDGPEPIVKVTVTITNLGDRTGTETVQLYVSHPATAVSRPEQELRGYDRITLEPGQTGTVQVTLTARAFAYWNEELNRWHVAPGRYDLRVSASSRDLRAGRTIGLTGEPLRHRLTAEDDAATWLADPEAGPWLADVFTGQDLGGMLLNPDEGRMLRAIPLIRLARTPGTGLDEALVVDAVRRFSTTS